MKYYNIMFSKTPTIDIIQFGHGHETDILGVYDSSKSGACSNFIIVVLHAMVFYAEPCYDVAQLLQPYEDFRTHSPPKS